MNCFTFPLTPALSLGERGNRIQALGESNDGICRTIIEKPGAGDCCSFSLRERVRVRILPTDVRALNP